MGLDYPSWAWPDVYPYRFDVDKRAQSDRDGAESLSGFVQGVGYLMSAAGPFVFAGLHALTKELTVAFGSLLQRHYSLLSLVHLWFDQNL
jgi:cyanate permease